MSTYLHYAGMVICVVSVIVAGVTAQRTGFRTAVPQFVGAAFGVALMPPIFFSSERLSHVLVWIFAAIYLSAFGLFVRFASCNCKKVLIPLRRRGNTLRKDSL